MALPIRSTSGEVALVAATPKTIWQVLMPANQRGKVKGYKIMGKQAAGGTDPVTKFRITKNAANFGTGSAATKYIKGAGSETPLATYSANFTAEPTSPTDLGDWMEVNPELGLIFYYPFGQEDIIPGGTSWQIEATAPSGTPTWTVSVELEE